MNHSDIETEKGNEPAKPSGSANGNTVQRSLYSMF